MRNRFSTRTVAAIVIAMALGCGSDDNTETDATDKTEATDTTDTTEATDATEATDVTDATDATDATDGTDATETAVVPTSGNDLFAWLQADSYSGWEAEAAVHKSGGPHGDVRTFVNETLGASLAGGGVTHPVGAAAVKELYGGEDLIGWAVSVKTQADSAGGDGWYWYEILSTTSSDGPVADGNGVGLCKGCHSGGGVDYVLIGYPFE